MLTKNGKTALAIAATVGNINIANNSYGLLPVKNYTGDVRYINSSNYNWPMTKSDPQFSLSYNNYGAILIGSGGTTATEDDYCLESLISAGLAGSVVKTYSLDTTNNKVTLVLDVTINNVSGSDITIREIGMIGRLSSTTVQNASTGSNVTQYMLIDRTVLDSPVTIAAGDSEVIRYTISAGI